MIAWKEHSTADRKIFFREMIDKGASNEEIARHYTDATPKLVDSFIRSHSLRLTEQNRRSVSTNRLMQLRETAEKIKAQRSTQSAAIRDIRQIGGKDLDTAPDPNGVHFEATNRKTCKWPMWDGNAPAEQRVCCGAETQTGRAYCPDHESRSRGRFNEHAAVQNVRDENAA